MEYEIDREFAKRLVELKERLIKDFNRS